MMQRGRSQSDLLTELELAHTEHYACLDLLRGELERAGIRYEEVSRSNLPPSGRAYDGIFTVGGDGTLLSASRLVTDRSPLIGIRSSSSSVGFLCAASAPAVPRLVTMFKERRLVYQETARLMATIEYAADHLRMHTVPVLNDFLFANANPAATTRYRIELGDSHEVQKSSGVWLSTSVGSTAAILAAGGQEMAASDKRFQFVVRELYKGEGIPFRLVIGLFDPDHVRFAIENRSEYAMLALDGQRETIALKYGDLVTFLRAPSILIAKSIL